MNEMAEVRIGGGNNLIVLKDNDVKSGILPERQSELTRNVTVQGNVVVEGGVFANQLEVDDGPAEFRSAVYTSSELHVKNSAASAVTFRKAVASAGVVSAFVASGRVLFGADINAQTVRLKNCYVGGSIYGTEVELESCVVLGGVFASKKLSMGNVMVGTFHAPEVDLAGTNYLFYPTAFSVEPMIALPGTELYSLALADLGSLFKGDPQKQGSGKILMNLKEDAQRTVLVDEEGANILVNSYSVATRVLVADLADPAKLENHFLLKAGALGTQLQKVYTLPKADGSRSAELTIENIADFLFRILDGSLAVADLEGTVTFDELRERFGYPAAPKRRDIPVESPADTTPVAAPADTTPATEAPADTVPAIGSAAEEPLESTQRLVPENEPELPEVHSDATSVAAEPEPAAVEPASTASADESDATSPLNAAEGTAENTPGPRFCWNCGTPLQPGNKFCRNCGKPVR